MTKILLVEDEPHLLMALEDTLLEEGFRVVTANNGHRALNVLADEKVDLVVSDVMMPGMDGFDLCRAVRAQPMNGSLPFVFLTALGEQADKRQGWEAGGDAYLVKPFEPDDLISLIRASLKRVHQVQESLDPRMKQLLDLDRMKTEHLAIASHEIKGALTAVQGFAEFLLIHDHEVETVRNYLDYIRQESAGLADMIDRLLELSAFERGTIRMQPDLVDLAALCEKVVAHAAQYHTRPRFRVHKRGEIPLIWGDRHWLKRALLNLVHNAAKYASDSPEVVVACQLGPRGVQVLVCDQGMGIAQSDLPRLGECFFRVKRPETQGIPGTGLGLALVRRVAEAHQANVLVESEPGKGSRIGFELPFSPVSEGPCPAP